MKLRILSTARLSFPLATAIAALLAAPSAQAVDYYWDSNDIALGAGDTPAGTWGTSTFWNTTAAGDVTAPTNAITTALDNVFFSAGSDAINAYSVGLGGATRDARLVTFEEGTATISNAASSVLRLGAGGGITVGTGTTTGATVSSGLTINGNSTFNVDAGRTLTLDTGTFTRGTRATLNIQGGGTVTSTQTGLSVNNASGIVGSWASIDAGAATRYATFSGANITAYTGSSVTPAGVVDTTGAANYEVSATSGTLGTNANFNTLLYTGGTGTLTTSTNWRANGIMNVGGGLLTIGTYGLSSSATEAVFNTANGDITFTTTFSSGVTKTGSGTMTISGASGTRNLGNYSVNQGTLALNGGRVTDGISGNGTINNGGTVTIGGLDNRIVDTATMTVNTGGLLNIGTQSDTIATLTLAGGSITGSTGVLGATSYAVQGGSISAILGGTGAMTKTTSGTVTLSGNNTFTGGVTINAGAVQLGNAGALNSTAGSENAVTFGSGSTGTLALAGNNVVVRSLTTNATPGTTFIQNANGSSVANATLTVGNSLNLASTYAGTIQDGTGGGTLALTKAGTNTLTLSGNNSYSGGTAINAGKILASNSNALGSGNVTMGGSSAGLQLQLSNGVNIGNALTMNGGSTTGQGIIYAVGNATYSGNITINSNALNGGGHFAASGSNNLELSGVITSSVNVVQRLGSVTYSGGGTAYTNLDVTGTAKVGVLNGIASTAAVSIGVSAAGTLDLNGNNQSLVGITKGPNAATIGSSSTTANSVLTTTGTSTYAGTIVDVLGSGNQTVGLTVASGALTLTGNNTYTGLTTISGGSLQIGSGGTTGSIASTSGVINDAALIYNRSNDLSATYPISGNGTLTKLGAGLLTLTGTNSYAGGSTVTAGGLVFSSLAAKPAAGTHAFGAGTTLGLGVGGVGFFDATDIDNAFSGTMTGNLSNVTVTTTTNVGIDTTAGDFNYVTALAGNPTKGLVKLGANNLTLTLANPLTFQNSPLTISAGSVIVSGVTTLTLGGLSGAGGLDLTGLTNLTLNTPTGVSLTYGGNITDGATGVTVTKTGAGTQTLIGTNSYTGATQINDGILVFGNKAAKASATATAAAAGTIGLGVHDTTATFYSAIEVGDLFNTNSLAGFNLDAGSGVAIDTTSSGGSFDQNFALTAARSLTKLGVGTLTLSTANTYSGATTISAGTLSLSTATSTLGDTTSATTVASGAALRLGANMTLGEALTLSGTGVGLADNTYGALFLNVNTAAITLAGPITLSGGAAFNTYNGGLATIQIAQGIGGTGDLTLRASAAGNGGALYRLQAASTYNGNTTFSTQNAGSQGITVQNEINDALPTGTVLTIAAAASQNAVYRLNGTNQTVAGLQTSGTSTLNTITGGSATLSTLTVNNSADYTFAGRLGNTGANDNNLALTKTSGGILTLSAANTYTGATTVSEGTLAITGSGGFSGSSAINITSGAFLTTTRNNTFNNGSGGTPTGAWTIAGTLTHTANGSTMPASVTLNNGTMSASAAVSAFGTFLTNANTTITANGASNAVSGGGNVGLFTGLTVATPLIGDALAISSQLGGTSANGGGLTKNGLGTVTLSSTSTYTGGTTIGGGTLALSGSGSIASSASVTISAAGTLDTSAQPTYVIPAAKPVNFTLDPTGSGSSGKITAAGLDITTAVVTLNPTATLDDPAYVLATYTGTLGGTEFAAPLPTVPGYTLDYAYQGDKIALVQNAGFSSWITGTFANGTVPALQQGPNADPDNDGISNLVEFAIAGQDPTVPNATIGTFDGTTLSFTKRLPLAASLTYAIQESTDLGISVPWTAVTGTPPTYVNDGTTISYTLTPGTPAKNFIRLQVLSN